MRFEDKMITYVSKVVIILGFLLALSYDYIIFHTLTEFYCIAVAFSIFILIYNAKKYIEKTFLYIVSTAFLAVGFFDILHVMSFEKMPLYIEGYNYDILSWLAARLIQVFSLMLATYLLNKEVKVKTSWVFLGYFIITVIFSLLIFSNVFHGIFVSSGYPTTLKVLIDILLVVVIILAIYFLTKNRNQLSNIIYHYILWALVFLFFSEVLFDLFYLNVMIINIFGQLFKVITYYFLYKAVIKIGILEPFDIIFKDLKTKEAKLEELLLKDDLTDTYNRRTCFNILEGLQKDSEFDSDFFATICFIDVDDLKMVNDEYGHNEGDELIKTMSDAFNQVITKHDYLFRIGGDEFLLILPYIQLDNAVKIINKVKDILQKCKEEFKKPYHYSFSYGFSILDQECEGDFDKLIDLADQNMYENKKNKNTYQGFFNQK